VISVAGWYAILALVIVRVYLCGLIQKPVVGEICQSDRTLQCGCTSISCYHAVSIMMGAMLAFKLRRHMPGEAAGCDHPLHQERLPFRASA
jgi:hypothetical protein